jgi:23S rRNA G2445 N2-methylase RlmL
VTIGAGYDLKYRTEKEVEKDLKEAGMSQIDINILKKGVKLTNKEADNFVKQNPNFRVDEKVKKQLFCNEYNKKSKITKRIIEKTKEIKWDDIPNNVKEYLVDLTYRGDLIPKIQPKIRQAVKDIIENKNTKKFEELNLSLHGKKIPE